MKEIVVNELDKEIIEWFKQKYPSLKPQLEAAIISKKEYSGVGFFLHFDFTDKSQLEVVNFDNGHINGPGIESDELPYGAGSILFITDGFLDWIEMFAYGDSFPEELDDFNLSIVKFGGKEQKYVGRLAKLFRRLGIK